jgi:Tfp pilus assembly protein FimV
MVAIAHPAARRTAPRFVRQPAVTYRRRRLVAGVLVVLVLLSLVTTAGRLLGGDADAIGRARPVAELSVVVEPGDTVWSIAEALAGGDDVRPVVDAIVAANGGAQLVAGERLLIALP